MKTKLIILLLLFAANSYSQDIIIERYQVKKGSSYHVYKAVPSDTLGFDRDTMDIVYVLLDSDIIRKITILSEFDNIENIKTYLYGKNFEAEDYTKIKTSTKRKPAYQSIISTAIEKDYDLCYRYIKIRYVYTGNHAVLITNKLAYFTETKDEFIEFFHEYIDYLNEKGL